MLQSSSPNGQAFWFGVLAMKLRDSMAMQVNQEIRNREPIKRNIGSCHCCLEARRWLAEITRIPDLQSRIWDEILFKGRYMQCVG